MYSLLQFQQLCDETYSWINEKDQTLSTEDCGRDLPSVQALQRKHVVNKDRGDKGLVLHYKYFPKQLFLTLAIVLEYFFSRSIVLLWYDFRHWRESWLL